MIVNRKTLHACSLFASREASRPYLCGVHVEVGPWGMRYCATDGFALILLFDAEGKQEESESILLPTELCKPPARGETCVDATARADMKDVFLSLPNGNTLVGPNHIAYAPYPDVAAVIPASRSLLGKIAQFDPGLVGRFADFAGRMMGRKAGVRPVVLHNGDGPAVVIFTPRKSARAKDDHPGIENAMGVVMPVRMEGVMKAEEWERPGWFEVAFPPRATFDVGVQEVGEKV